MHATAASSHRMVAVVLLLGVAAYSVAAWMGLPQQATDLSLASHGAASADASGMTPPWWTVAPFVLLLLGIAVLPLRAAVWWDNNLHRFYLAAGLGLLVLAYYLLVDRQPVRVHWPFEHILFPQPHGPNLAGVWAVWANAVFYEYLPFIILLFTLYVIAGGLRIEGRMAPSPSTNAGLLAVGAVFANLIGTTGAAILLIRPLLEMNRQRRHVRHTVVFFIFIVCNCGGCLLPLGDPPLFLGYLLGVPFLFTLKLWPIWLFVNAALVAIYFVWDWLLIRTGRDTVPPSPGVERGRRLSVVGLWPNGLFLLGVVFSVAFLDPGKPLPGTEWHPWIYLREAVQLGLVFLSLTLGSTAVRESNGFNYRAIVEVAVLFLGIFVTMQPALQILHVRGPQLGLARPVDFFWATGSLSSVLDNAPTYAVFFETARSIGGDGAIAGVSAGLLAAISLGAVFMGAMTYIGNGPNFMVRSIAEESGVAMPSFFGYILYSATVLLPLFAAVSWLFLRSP